MGILKKARSVRAAEAQSWTSPQKPAWLIKGDAAIFVSMAVTKVPAGKCLHMVCLPADADAGDCVLIA